MQTHPTRTTALPSPPPRGTQVDELGTEAAAATAVVMLRSMILPANELLLKFDRPFAFFITHDPSGLALFAGEVQRPDEWRQGA